MSGRAAGLANDPVCQDPPELSRVNKLVRMVTFPRDDSLG